MNKEKNDGPIIKAPQAVERPSKRPPCYRAEIPNPYKRPPCDSPEIQKPSSRCVGWGMKTCAHCRFWTDYEPGEDESRVNLPLSLVRLREMDGFPAWWECGPEYSCWGIIAVDSCGLRKSIPFFQGRWREVDFVYNIEARNMEIYRRPPDKEGG